MGIDFNLFFCFVLTIEVLYPTNIRSESLITLRPKEHHYERSTLLFDIQLDEVQLHIDPQQVSDILDFLKLQNYTTIFGLLFVIFLVSRRPKSNIFFI